MWVHTKLPPHIDTPASTHINTHTNNTEKKYQSAGNVGRSTALICVIILSHSIVSYKTHGYTVSTHAFKHSLRTELNGVEHRCSDIINGAHCGLYGSSLTTWWLHWLAAAAAVLTATVGPRKTDHTHMGYELTLTCTRSTILKPSLLSRFIYSKPM